MRKIGRLCLIVALCIACIVIGCALCFCTKLREAAVAAVVVGAVGGFVSLWVIWSTLCRDRRLMESSFLKCESIPNSCIFAPQMNRLLEERKASVSKSNLETAYRNSQLQVLMGQINPHFLYNTLESIRGQALFSDDEIVADMAETLSGFFRYCISRKGEVVRLRDEIQNVRTYLKIMEFRFPEKFTFKIIGDVKQLEDFEIPKLTLQPIVENAIMHGIMDFNTGGQIVLRILKVDCSMKIYIRDNGVGINDEKVRNINERFLQGQDDVQVTDQQKSNGIALYNINRRIKLTYGEKYGIRLFSTEHMGTNVMIYLPQKPYES